MTTFANDDFLLEDHGDRDGVQAGRKIGDILACVTMKVLHTGDQQWTHHGNHLLATLRRGYDKHQLLAMDVRTLGLAPGTLRPGQLGSTIHGIAERSHITDWQITEAGTVIRIIGTSDAADDLEIIWELDKDRDLNPIRVALRRGGRVVAESKSTLKKFDGMWFPESVMETALKDNRGRFRIEKRYTVQAAQFNSPDLPREIGPEHLGMVPGVNVVVFGEPAPMFWTGEILVDVDAWRELVQSHAVDRSGFNRRRAEFSPRGPQARYPAWYNDPTMGLSDKGPRDPELWEDYVRRFGLRHGLDEKQKSAAQAILKESQKAGRAALARVEQTLKPGAAAAAGGAETGAESADDHDRKAAELLRPVEEVFHQLQRRLDGLLTEAQREAASKGPPPPTPPATAKPPAPPARTP